jgi:hypothetical protein
MIRGKMALFGAFDPTKMMPGAHLRAKGSIIKKISGPTGAAATTDDDDDGGGALISSSSSNNDSSALSSTGTTGGDEAKKTAAAAPKQAIGQVTHIKKTKMKRRGGRRAIRKVFTKPGENRGKTLQEFIMTEKMYVMLLQQFVTHAAAPLMQQSKSSCGVSEKQGKMIAGGMLVLKKLHEAYLKDLQLPSANLCDTLIKHSAQFTEIYKKFVRSFFQALKCIHELRSVAKFRRFVRELRTGTQRLDLVDALLMPFQRMQVYELLLRKLLQMTPPEHAERKLVEQAIEAVKQVSLSTSKTSALAENCSQVLIFQNKLQASTLPLWSLKRRILRKGHLDKRKQKKGGTGTASRALQRYIVLFNDMLLWATAEPDVVYKGHVALSKCTASAAAGNAIRIEERGANNNDDMLLVCQSDVDQAQWLRVFTDAIAALPVTGGSSGDTHTESKASSPSSKASKKKQTQFKTDDEKASMLLAAEAEAEAIAVDEIQAELGGVGGDDGDAVPEREQKKSKGCCVIL